MRRIPCFLATTVFLAAMFLTGCPKKSVTVDFRADVTSGVIPLDVQFTDISDPGDSTITAWHWLFGDDSVAATEQHPFHRYAKDGVFTVTLTVTTADGRDIAASKSAYITVAKMMPNITAWPTANAITFGQTLSAATLTGGAASVDGTFMFEAPAAIPDAGIYIAAVRFIPKDTVNYSVVSGTVNVTVAKALPSVTAWPAVSDIIYGLPLSASSLTGGVSSVPGTFEFDEPDVVLNAGIHTVAAIFRPANLQNYSTVPGTVNITVGQAAPNVTMWPTASSITYGQTLASSALHGGTASVPGAFSFDTPAMIPSAGTYPAAITFTPTDTVNYMAAAGTVSVTVNKATPSITAWPSAGTVVSGQPLSSTTLTGGKASVDGSFAFAAPATIPSAGNYVAAVIFTPTDSRNYTTVSGSVNVSVIVIVFVRPGASGNGSSWASALSSIQEAINAAGTGEVWVAAGTYRENVTMRNGVKLFGGFVGMESSRDARNWQTNKTVIDGQKKDSCIKGANNAVIDGFTIQNGTAAMGGGMYNNGVSPTVINCTFTGNSATSSSGTASNSGGGMYNNNCSPTVNNCTFTGNHAKGNTVFNTGGGGGMFNTGGSPILSNCTFIGNSAGYASGATGARGGGGMHNDYSSPKLTNCTFSGNTTVKRGGGMYNDYSSPAVTDCIFNENSAQSEGGAMFNSGSSSPTMNYCAFGSNSAWQGGAIYTQHGAKPKVTSCIFNGNIASSTGGAMNNNMSSSVTVTNCLFVANNADRGGAMYSWSPSSFKMTNCTFTYNAALYGGGIYSGYSSAPKITNCILWGNTATRGGNEIYKDAESGVITVTYSCVKGGHGGTGNISSNPMFVDDVNGDYSLQSGSPCIDTGTSVAAPAEDILGIVRPQGGGHDMGAYELPVP